jgi:hypothetical protein
MVCRADTLMLCSASPDSALRQALRQAQDIAQDTASLHPGYGVAESRSGQELFHIPGCPTPSADRRGAAP